MSIIVEDGTIVTGAESYVTVDSADAYHSSRGNADWSGLDQVKEAALRKAASFLDGYYRGRWKGYRVDPLNQRMEWPRESVCVDDVQSSIYGALCLPSNVIPDRVKDAQCELALRAMSSDLAPDIDGNIARERIDVIETEYFPGFGPGRPEYRAVEMLLSDLVRPRGSNDVVRG